MNDRILDAADGPAPRSSGDYRIEHAQSAQLLVVVVFSGLTGLWLVRGPAVSPESPSGSAVLRTGVDPNDAAWYELAQLPGVGENLARRIVEYRNVGKESRKDRRVFRRAADLALVRGIGDKTVRRLSAFLCLDARAAPSIVDRPAGGG